MSAPETANQAQVTRVLDQIQEWVEQRNYKGYEPFDGLSSWFRPLTFGSQFAERLLMQANRQSPLNLRPLLGISPQESTKGRGYMAAGYLARYRATQDAAMLAKAEACLDWLDHHRARKYPDHSWSNHFDFTSRGGTYTKDDPIIVWTALIGFSYLDAYEVTRNARWLEIADSVCRWIMKLPREKTATGSCLSYLAHKQSSIHNSNMLGAAMLAHTAHFTGNKEYQDVAASAMEYSCVRQLADGAWWYGEAAHYHWIDNFHTGYNLCSLDRYLRASQDLRWQPNLELGLTYFTDHFFEPDGCPKYYHDRRYPIDSQCAAQAIETLAEFSDRRSGCLDLGRKVARWTIDNMQCRDGHFCYRIYPLLKARTPMLHWTHATLFLGFAKLNLALQQSAGAAAKNR